MGSFAFGLIIYMPFFFVTIFAVKLWRKLIAQKMTNPFLQKIIAKIPLAEKLISEQDIKMTDKTKKSKKKIVSVKKLSRFYKKTYTTDSFEKKILQKLFIESDKNLVSKLFITKKAFLEFKEGYLSQTHFL